MQLLTDVKQVCMKTSPDLQENDGFNDRGKATTNSNTDAQAFF